jgi:hypothetical protein
MQRSANRSALMTSPCHSRPLMVALGVTTVKVIMIVDAIQEIREMLHRFPRLRAEATNNHIKVVPDSSDGFSVEINKEEEGYSVFFEGWHQSFTEAEEAYNCFWYGLSTDCRLKEYRRWGFAYRWELEYKEEGVWVQDSATTLLLFPYIGKKRVRILQNKLIASVEDTAAESSA